MTVDDFERLSLAITSRAASKQSDKESRDAQRGDQATGKSRRDRAAGRGRRCLSFASRGAPVRRLNWLDRFDLDLLDLLDDALSRCGQRRDGANGEGDLREWLDDGL